MLRIESLQLIVASVAVLQLLMHIYAKTPVYSWREHSCLPHLGDRTNLAVRHTNVVLFLPSECDVLSTCGESIHA